MASSSWFEVWADETADPPYLLLIRSDPDQESRLLVIDPKEGYRVIHHDVDYEALKLWLLEDEYTRVTGRMTSEQSET